MNELADYVNTYDYNSDLLPNGKLETVLKYQLIPLPRVTPCLIRYTNREIIWIAVVSLQANNFQWWISNFTADKRRRHVSNIY